MTANWIRSASGRGWRSEDEIDLGDQRFAADVHEAVNRAWGYLDHIARRQIDEVAPDPDPHCPGDAAKDFDQPGVGMWAKPLDSRTPSGRGGADDPVSITRRRWRGQHLGDLVGKLDDATGSIMAQLSPGFKTMRNTTPTRTDRRRLPSFKSDLAGLAAPSCGVVSSCR